MWKPFPSGSYPHFYFSDFFLKEQQPWFTHEKTAFISPKDLINQISLSAGLLSTPTWERECPLFFEEAFVDLKQKMSDGSLAKAVPFVMETAQSPMSPERLVSSIKHALLYQARSPTFLYGFWGEHEGILGVTPELLFKFVEENQLETMACAGTRKTSDNPQALLSDPKEMHEHRVVVEGIAESLTPFGDVLKGELQLLTLPNLTHLMTPIHVTLKAIPNIEDIVKALHPTPALGAFPREAGSLWLQEYQNNIDRQRFGAPVGYVHSTQANFYVAIRNVQWDKKQMRIAAGCGIVPASQLEREKEEINLKLRAIKEMLSL